MSFPTYFSNFPNLNYAVSLDKAGNKTSVEIKDFFHLLKVREDIYKASTVYDSYIIKDGMKPDQVSKELYGDERYYWVVLQANDIVDYYNEWPLSPADLDDYIKTRYGFPGSEEVHHYETLEVKDEEGNIVQPAGLKVSADYVFEYPSYPGSTVRLTSRPVSVSIRQYEYDLNLKKSQISVVKPQLIVRFEEEVRAYGSRLTRLMDKSSQY